MSKNFEAVTEKIRENLLAEFDSLKELKDKDNLTENDLEFYLARDRKAALVLKTLDMDLKNEVLRLKRGKKDKQITQ